jgi:hypothetical protein
MKTRSTNSSNAATARDGLEPVLLMIANWGGFATKYATKNITVNGLYYGGRILDWGGVTTQERSESSGDTGNITINLDDHDGAVSARLTSAGSEKVTVTISVYYDGISGSTPTEVFRGVVANPIAGNQGDCTLSLECVTDVVSNQVGYILTEDQDLSNRNDDALGKTWPLVFGKAAHVPALLAQRGPRTTIENDLYYGDQFETPDFWNAVEDRSWFGVDTKDITILQKEQLYGVRLDQTDLGSNVVGSHVRANIIDVDDSSDFPRDELITVIINDLPCTGKFEDDNNLNRFKIDDFNVAMYEGINPASRPPENISKLNYSMFYLDENDVTNLIGKYLRFSQAGNPQVNVYETGAGSEAYTERRVVRQEGRRVYIDKPLINKNNRELYAINQTTQFDVYAQTSTMMKISVKEGVDKIKNIMKGKPKRKNTPEAKIYWPIIQKLQIIKFRRDAWWSTKKNSTFKLWSQDDNASDDVYIANSVTSNAVTGVYAKRKDPDTGETIFDQVPQYLYSKNLSEATSLSNGPSTVTTIRFDEPLSELRDQGWSDGIYVTVDSTLSANTATAIKWILDTYTNLDTDTSTFASVATKLTYFPSNFALLKSQDAIKLVTDMAWQCRCALIFASDDVKIRYLQDHNANWSLGSCDDGALEFGSFKSTAQSAGDLTTRLIGEWKESYRPASSLTLQEELDNEKIYENNISDFGLIESKVDMFIYNSESLVAKTINFWGNRKSNVWMEWNATAFHNLDVAEVFDSVTLASSTHDPPFPFTGSVKGDIISTNLGLLEGNNALHIRTNIAQGQISANSLYYQSDSESSSPDNPADLVSEGNGTFYSQPNLSLSEVISGVKRVLNKIKTKGRISIPTVDDEENKTEVACHHDGLSSDGNESVFCSNVNPHYDVPDEGVPCSITYDEDGDAYIEPMDYTQRVEVITQNDDELIVRVVPDGEDISDEDDDGTNDITIKKPYDLQRTPWDAQTEVDDEGTLINFVYTSAYERTLTEVDDEDVTEDQIIIPPYVERQQISDVWYRGSILEITYMESYGGIVDVNHIGRKWGKYP